MQMYPGDDLVDIMGVHYYDSGPEKNTQATWDQYYNITYNGQPWGIGTWLAAAQAHGKRLGVAEWGVWAQGLRRWADDPVYIANMYKFFKTTRPASPTRPTSTRCRTSTCSARRPASRGRPPCTSCSGTSASRPARPGQRLARARARRILPGR